jgi:hypothetical protein
VDETVADAERRGHQHNGEQDCSHGEYEAGSSEARKSPPLLRGDSRDQKPAVGLEALRRQLELRWKRMRTHGFNISSLYRASRLWSFVQICAGPSGSAAARRDTVAPQRGVRQDIAVDEAAELHDVYAHDPPRRVAGTAGSARRSLLCTEPAACASHLSADEVIAGRARMSSALTRVRQACVKLGPLDAALKQLSRLAVQPAGALTGYSRERFASFRGATHLIDAEPGWFRACGQAL